MYRGDYLKENLRYQLYDKAKCTEDEIQYLFGNEKATTMGCHYIDYKSDEILILLNTKIDRISAFLEENDTIDPKGKGYVLSRRPTNSIIEINANKNDLITLTVSSKHGANIVKGKESAGK